MKVKFLIPAVAVLAFVLSGCATSTSRNPASDDAHGGGGHADNGGGGRSHSVPDNGRHQTVTDHNGRPVADNNNRPVRVPVMVDIRHPDDIRNDPRIRVVAFADVHVVGHWDSYYPASGWLAAWNLNPRFRWNTITAVACEAVNVISGENYPTSGLTDGGWAWSDATVNQLLGEALDDCDTDPNGVRDANGVVECVAASPSCTPTY